VKLSHILQTTIVIGIIAAGSIGGWYLLQVEPKHSDAHGHQGEHTDDHADEGEHGAHEEEEAEDRTTIADAVAARSGIVTAVAESREIIESLNTTGFIEPDPNRVARVASRFTGTVLELLVHPGEQVAAGQVLAQVENQSTAVVFPVVSPLNGTVLESRMQPGELASESSYILVADLSKVWAQLRIFSGNGSLVKVGQAARVRALNGAQAKGEVSYVSPIASPGSQTRLARVALDNTKGNWLPGLFISGSFELSSEKVSLAVARSALQTFEGSTVLFVKEGEAYEARMVELGRTDAEWAEVLSGIEPGEEYVTENSFLIKADILKSGATHDH